MTPTTARRRLARLSSRVADQRGRSCACPWPLVIIPERGDPLPSDPCDRCGLPLRYRPLVIGERPDGPQ
jgi:hypothetical protein